VQNISRSGIFVRTRCAYELDETVMVSLYFFNGSVTLSVTLPCKVARMENNGAGLTAQGIDLEEFLFIHNLTHARSGNPARFMESFYEYVADQDSSNSGRAAC